MSDKKSSPEQPTEDLLNQIDYLHAQVKVWAEKEKKKRAEAEVCTEKKDQLQYEESQAISRYGERAIKGEGTKDPIRDFCMAVLKSSSKNLANGYREIEKKLKKDQCILIVSEKASFRRGHKEVVVKLDYQFTKIYQWGILLSDKFDIDLVKGKCCFPTERYIELDEDSKLHSYDGCIHLENTDHLYRVLDLYKELDLNESADVRRRPHNKSEIVVGYEKILKWFKQRGSPSGIQPTIEDFHMYEKGMEMLGKTI